MTSCKSKFRVECNIFPYLNISESRKNFSFVSWKKSLQSKLYPCESSKVKAWPSLGLPACVGVVAWWGSHDDHSLTSRRSCYSTCHREPGTVAAAAAARFRVRWPLRLRAALQALARPLPADLPLQPPRSVLLPCPMRVTAVPTTLLL